MTIEEIKQLIFKDEHRQLEMKKTTGELKDGMHTACAFLNTDGGWQAATYFLSLQPHYSRSVVQNNLS